MNLILFERSDLQSPLPRSDRRARHLLEVLRRQPGDTFDAAIINGPRGKATLTALTADALTFTFAETPAAIPADAAAKVAGLGRPTITLIVGLPRPQTARDILRDATTLGIDALHFIHTDKAEASYAQSTLWSSGEWRRHALAGAEQAFDSQLPTITHGSTLTEAIATLAPSAARVTLDNYESPHALGAYLFETATTPSVALAIGAERGWSAKERERLRAERFAFVHLGSRVLRTETAVVAALAIVRAKLGLI